MENKLELLEKIAKAFAETDLTTEDCNGYRYCRFCNEQEDIFSGENQIDLIHHEDDCLVLVARNLMK